jgi:hypothetical protein
LNRGRKPNAPPLLAKTLARKAGQYLTPRNSVPAAWQSAGEYLWQSQINILDTDQSYITTGDCSIMHLARRSSAHPQHARVDMRYLARLMTAEGHAVAYTDWMAAHRNRVPETPAAIRGHRSLVTWFDSLDTATAFSMHDCSVFQTPAIRKANLSATITSVLRQNRKYAGSTTLATDGSHLIATATSPASTTDAVVGPIYASFRLMGQSTVAMHGELLALIAALHALCARTRRLPGGANETATWRILTDYLNAVHAAEAAQRPDFNRDAWYYRPAREYYRWMAATIVSARRIPADHRIRPQIDHVKAHTDARDDDSRLNAEADRRAKAAHTSTRLSTALIPAPTAYMHKFTPTVDGIGFDPDGWKNKVQVRLADYRLRHESASQRFRLFNFKQHDQPADVAPYYYTRSTSGLTAKVQLLTRLGQDHSNYLEWRKGQRASPACHLCPAPRQDAYHLYVECPAFEWIRKDALTSANKRFAKKRDASTTDEEIAALRIAWTEYVRLLVYGAHAHPTRYWLGHTPKTPARLSRYDTLAAHGIAVRLTSRIHGAYLRTARQGGPSTVTEELRRASSSLTQTTNFRKFRK